MTKKRTKKEWQEIIVIVTLIVTVLGTIGTWLAVPGFRDLLKFNSEINSVTPSLETPTNQSIYDLFPIFLGSEWKYQTSQTTEIKTTNGELKRVSVQGEYSQTITSIFTGLSDRAKIVEFKIEGENYQNECTSSSLISGDSFLWYVIDEDRLYVACSKEAANKIATQIVHQENTTDLPLPEYIAPLKLGTKWSEFNQDDANNLDSTYVWYVESIVPVTVPAGKYDNCYRILLYTNPDTTIKYICPNVGLVSFLYSHNGSVNDYSVELIKYSLP
jgi:hypothetical protein